MSQILTLSQFYYGQSIDRTNNYIDFNEGSGAISAVLTIGDYTLQTLAVAVATALTKYGTQTYTASVDRDTRNVTISASSNFSLLVSSGAHVGTSVYTMLGFTGSDLTGADTYTGGSACGDAYFCQYPLYQYIALTDKSVLETPSVNTSAKGIVQTLHFGSGRRMECEISMITNKTGIKGGVAFYSNTNGIADAQAFAGYIITKQQVEFMPDVSDTNTYYNVLLDAAELAQDGSGIRFKNMAHVDFYTMGLLQFREVHES